MSTQEIPSQTDFRERAKTNDVPIACLIGFEDALRSHDARQSTVPHGTFGPITTGREKIYG